jgi:hypothetical protein
MCARRQRPGGGGARFLLKSPQLAGALMAHDDVKDLTRRIALLAPRVNGDSNLVRRGRQVSLELRLELGDTPYRVAVERGRIAALEIEARPMRSYVFAVRGVAAAWRAFWQPVPPPHHHDIFALQKIGAFRIEGELYPLMANLLYFKAVLAAPRDAA